MRPVVVVDVLEAVDVGIDLLDLCGQVEDGVELVSPCAVASLDGAIELGSLGRQFVKDEALVLTGLLELGLEPLPAVDRDCLDLEGHVGADFAEEARGGYGGCAADLDPGPGARVFVWLASQPSSKAALAPTGGRIRKPIRHPVRPGKRGYPRGSVTSPRSCEILLSVRYHRRKRSRLRPTTDRA
jgi:hypothetical protein